MWTGQLVGSLNHQRPKLFGDLRWYPDIYRCIGAALTRYPKKNHACGLLHQQLKSLLCAWPEFLRGRSESLIDLDRQPYEQRLAANQRFFRASRVADMEFRHTRIEWLDLGDGLDFFHGQILPAVV